MKTITEFMLVIGGVILTLILYDYLIRVPTTDIDLLHIDRDTTFYIGRSGNNEVLGGQLSVRATGELDDSTALINIEYTSPGMVNIVRQIKLYGGVVETMATGDFYDQRAKVTYRHGGVKNGRLRLRAIFGFPPEDWAYKLKDDRWAHIE
jgi:hypothetical protein